jgi:hypothetical protein
MSKDVKSKDSVHEDVAVNLLVSVEEAFQQWTCNEKL